MIGLTDLVATGLVAETVPLAPLTTYRLGGPARGYAEAGSEADLAVLAAALVAERAAGHDVPVLVLGRGSNVAVADSGYPGLVVRLGRGLAVIEIDADGTVRAGGAAPLPVVARASVKAGRGGLEFFVGIPGSVGGAVRMNAGCFDSETAEWMVDALVISLDTGEASWLSPTDLGMRYRHSALNRDDVVAGARFRTVVKDAADGEAKLREITRWRRESQPGGTLNAGSIFKNPPGDAAGRLIDSLGLKGFAVGGAAVSTKHANFFVADATATAQDVYDLVWAVRRRVGSQTGIWLEPEVRFEGSFRASPDEAEREGADQSEEVGP